MSKFNIQGLISNISEKTSVYSPIVEAIVNSIQAVEVAKISNGIINIRLIRDNQIQLELEDDSLAKIKSIEITDNGIGFNSANRDSFDTFYSNQKVELGGKGFGRFIFLKYFEQVTVNSIYVEESKTYLRTFTFSVSPKIVQNLIENEKFVEAPNKEMSTTVILENIKDKYSPQLDKKLDTIARNLVEKLLPYFINSDYKCPTISLEDDTGEKIILNNYFINHSEIKKIADKEFSVERDEKKEIFKIKIFKIYFSKSKSSIIFTAHNRAVNADPLYEYVPEFRDDFYDVIENKDGVINKNYTIKAYLFGKYLDQNVELERDDFKFPKDSPDLFFPFSRKEISTIAVNIIVSEFKDDVVSRQKKKSKKIKDYIETKAPWHKLYFNDLDFTSIPYQFDESTIESELQKIKFRKDQSTQDKVNKILKEDEKQIADKIDKISLELTELGKSDLAHYVILRKVVLDLLDKSIKWNKDEKFEKERIIHNLLFPMNNDSDHLPYDKHNLWVIDERLSFHEYLASDKALNSNDDRPDLLIFDKALAIRDGEEFSNPITIFEFKRPQRENYSDDEDPIVQIGEYIEKIRLGNFKDIDGRNIKANSATPAYGYLICDITEKIKIFCKRHSLTLTPDGEGYFGYHTGYSTYFQVISFDKLVKDAELRNKIFFQKLSLK